MLVDVVVVSWNCSSHLQQLLDSFTVNDFVIINKVIIIDNASNEEEKYLLSNLVVDERINVKIVLLEKNIGFGRACNLGVKEHSEAEFILLLNPDTKVTPKLLESTISKFNSQVDLSLLGVQQIDDKGDVQKSCARFPTLLTVINDCLGLSRLLPGLFKSSTIMRDFDHKSTALVPHVIGAFWLIKRDVFLNVGGFDEAFFMYLEDLDFCKRLADNDKKVMFYADACLIHEGGGTTNKIKSKRLAMSLTSRILYYKKHFNKFSFVTAVFFTCVIEPIIRCGQAIVKQNFREVFKGYLMFIQMMKKK